MHPKLKTCLAAIALAAAGVASAQSTYTGSIVNMDVGTTDFNATVWVTLDTQGANCNGAGPIAILRMGSQLGAGTAADKIYSNMYALLLASQLANRPITVGVDSNCSLVHVKFANK